MYTGNWPKGSKIGAMKEGERLLANPHLKGKTVGFLGNHGSFLISETVEEALFDTFNLERLAELQVHGMRDASPFRELAPPKVKELKQQYMRKREQMARDLYHHHIKQIAAPLAESPFRASCSHQ